MATQRERPSSSSGQPQRRRQHLLPHKISILPPSSWAKIDLTELFNMDDYYNANNSPASSAHSGVRLSYTVPWHSPQHDTMAATTPDSPTSSIWSRATVTRLLDDTPTSTCSTAPPPPIYSDPDFRFDFADLKPPPLYLHPFYSRSGLPRDEGETRPSTAPPVAIQDWHSKPLPQLPRFGDEEAMVIEPETLADGQRDRA